MNKEDAEITVKRISELKSWVAPLGRLLSLWNSIESMYPDIEASKDEDLMDDLEKELTSGEKTLEELEIRRMFTRDEDKLDCFLNITAGAGGTESCDWALMLSRMYLRYAERRGWKTEILSELAGDVAGIKNMTIKVEGPYAYGYLFAEAGVHRLIRISPFDSNGKRHTSFASVDATPIISENIEIDIRPEDIRVDTFRASGAGGQGPAPGVDVPEQKLDEKREEIANLAGEKKEISWGSQIRNYVLHPYTLVKDPRTKYEDGDTRKILDGDIDRFIHAYLKLRGGSDKRN